MIPQTKYQSSRPFTFRTEDFSSFHYMYIMKINDPPRAGPILTRGPLFEQSWQRSTTQCFMPNILPVAFANSEKKIFLCFTIYILEKHMTPRGGANFDTRDKICTTLVLDLQMIPQTKYQSSRPFTFRPEDFSSFHYMYVMKINDPPGRGQF